MRNENEETSLNNVINLLKKYNINTYKTFNQYDSVDLMNENMEIEVKNRRLSRKDFYKYSENGFIYEKTKYDSKINNYLYVNTFYFDDKNIYVILIWKIDSELFFEKKLLPKTSDIIKNDDSYIYKMITYLKIDQAKIYIMEEDKFKKCDDKNEIYKKLFN